MALRYKKIEKIIRVAGLGVAEIKRKIFSQEKRTILSIQENAQRIFVPKIVL